MSSTQKQQDGAESSAVAPPPPPPPAADPIPHEPAWHLLLGELWQDPEQQVVCRLLCCSRAMARLVHAACAGRALVSISRQPIGNDLLWHRPEWQQEVTAQGKAYGAWLTKHARLVAVLRLDVWFNQDESATAGLVAAAQPQPLPLRSLSLTISGGWWHRLLPSLAVACPQLTQLQLEGCIVERQLGHAPEQQLATAFTALTGLRELSLISTNGALVLPFAVPALQLGTQLTKLRLLCVELSAKAFRSLPPSLVDLEYNPDAGRRWYGGTIGTALPVGHLTALTRLACCKLDAGTIVPPGVQQLKLAWCENPALLHHLTRLRSLECGDMVCSLEQLQAAVSAIGPSLAALDVRACGDLRSALLSQLVCCPSLPLTGLTINSLQTSVAHLGQWTGLTSLALSYVEATETPQQVAQQLQQLTALRELSLRVTFRAQPQASLQPLVDGVVGMRSLRSLSLKGVLDAQQRAQLQGMTQLMRLVV